MAKRLIARWTADQDPETDPPITLHWSDGTPATAADFERIDTSTQSGPSLRYAGDGTLVGVEFGYAIKETL